MGKHVVVIGGGVAGLEVAGQLSKVGIEVSLIEKDSRTGGHLNKWYRLFPDRRKSSEVKEYLNGITANNGINLMTDTSIEMLNRHRDHFSIITSGGRELIADAIIVATGFDLFKSARKEEYGYGIYDNVITSADLEEMFLKEDGLLTSYIWDNWNQPLFGIPRDNVLLHGTFPYRRNLCLWFLLSLFSLSDSNMHLLKIR